VKVLVAPDKFKGSLTAHQVAEHLATGLRTVRGVQTDQLPLADGGDGSVQAAVTAGYQTCPVRTVGPTGQPVSAEVAFNGRTAIVEVANTCGISLLPGGQRQPLHSSSYGFGQAINAALALHPTTVVLALGGSASTDGGMGMLTALGAVFASPDGQELIGSGADLSSVSSADLNKLDRLRQIEWIIASDVDAPLYGLHGAAHVFGPQKGASPTTVEHLDQGLRHFVATCRPSSDRLADRPGAGAAGGIGFAGLMLGARVVSGASYFLDLLHFDHRVADADVVITGEGRMDDQTLQGKLPFVVAKRAAPRPVHAVVGRNDLATGSDTHFAQIHQLSDHTTHDSAADPALSATILTQIGHAIATSLVTRS